MNISLRSIVTSQTVGSEPKGILKNKTGSLSNFEQPEISYPPPPQNDFDESQTSFKIYSVETLPDVPPSKIQEPEYSKPVKKRKEKLQAGPPRKYDEPQQSVAGMGAGTMTGVMGISGNSPMTSDYSYQETSQERYMPPAIGAQDVYNQRGQPMSASRPSVETEI